MCRPHLQIRPVRPKTVKVMSANFERRPDATFLLSLPGTFLLRTFLLSTFCNVEMGSFRNSEVSSILIYIHVYSILRITIDAKSIAGSTSMGSIESHVSTHGVQNIPTCWMSSLTNWLGSSSFTLSALNCSISYFCRAFEP